MSLSASGRCFLCTVKEYTIFSRTCLSLSELGMWSGVLAGNLNHRSRSHIQGWWKEELGVPEKAILAVLNASLLG